jgi:leucyl aminopeptidase (aminopeptidase T)
VDVEGSSPQAEMLRQIFDTIENARNVGECSIGTNRWARSNGVVSEEKKMLGNVHTCYGRGTHDRNWFTEVRSAIHGDMVLRRVTIEASGKLIMKDGQLLL